MPSTRLNNHPRPSTGATKSRASGYRAHICDTAAGRRRVALEGTSLRRLVAPHGRGRPRLAGRKLRIIAEKGRAIGAHDPLFITNVEEHMGMILGRSRPDAHEFPGPDLDHGNPHVVLKMRRRPRSHANDLKRSCGCRAIAYVRCVSKERALGPISVRE